jgi:hypothetical protein
MGEFAKVDSMLIVVNNSRRPIRSVTCKLARSATSGESEPEKLADEAGELRPYPPDRQEDTFIVVGGPIVPVIKVGAKGGFIWSPADRPELKWLNFWVRFTDDAGLYWEIDTGLHLEKLAERDW